MPMLVVECYDLAKMIKWLSEHSSAESAALFHVYRWLYLAAGVTDASFSFELARSEYSFGYCESADEFSVEQDKMHGQLVTSISRFLFIWSSVEALVEDVIRPESGKPPGKINDVCRYIQSHFSVEHRPERYYQSVERFHRALSSLRAFDLDRANLQSAETIGPYGYGLYSVYKVRNHIAHGSLVLPNPFETSSGLVLKLIDFASDILLCSIQILLSCYHTATGINHIEVEDYDGVVHFADVQKLITQCAIPDFEYPDGLY